MAAPLTFKVLTKKRACTMYKCRNVTSYMLYRGRHSSYEAIFLCEDCIKDIVRGYADAAGADKARALFSDVFVAAGEPRVKEDKESASAPKPASSGKKAAKEPKEE